MVLRRRIGRRVQAPVVTCPAVNSKANIMANLVPNDPLGHNLGLGHGGADAFEFKPNF